MKKITILGSTGSIGTQTLDVIRKNRERFSVEALTCGGNKALLREQIKEFRPRLAVISSSADAKDLASEFPDVEFSWGRQGLIEAAQSDCNIILNSLMGMRGLEPTYYAIEAGKDIALANKETLVAGGDIIMKKVAEKGVRMLPVDSEHSAIFQCLEGNIGRPLKKILLTASGGPFRNYTAKQLENVTLQQALKHPKWTMGAKITIDSATMMNKGLEVIEACHLFNVEPSKIQILVHPQSIVHSAVEFMDNSIIAQLGIPDMRIPISLALGYPDRLESDEAELDFFDQGANLTFEKPDTKVFKCIELAYGAIEMGGSCPAALNAANEVLVDMFLKEQIEFIEIQQMLTKVMREHEPVYNAGLDDIIAIDREVRERVRESFSC